MLPRLILPTHSLHSQPPPSIIKPATLPPPPNPKARLPQSSQSSNSIPNSPVISAAVSTPQAAPAAAAATPQEKRGVKRKYVSQPPSSRFPLFNDGSATDPVIRTGFRHNPNNPYSGLMPIEVPDVPVEENGDSKRQKVTDGDVSNRTALVYPM